MRRLRSEARALLLALALAPPLAGQEVADPESGGATFLLIPVGARAAALGQAAIADAGSPESAFWNPAGLALLPATEFSVHYATTFASNNTAVSGYYSSHGLGIIGAAAYLVDYGSQEVTQGPGPPLGRISVKNIELLASYATELVAALSIGLNYKLIQFRQECSGECGTTRTVVGTTHGVDVGVQYALGGDDRFRIGVAVRHAGLKLQLENRDQADPLPTRVQIGIAYRLPLPQAPNGREGFDARVLIDLQDAWGEYDNPDTRVGVELGYGDVLRIRSGYAFLHSESSGPSVGIGLHFGRISIDFARILYTSSSFDEPVHISLSASL